MSEIPLSVRVVTLPRRWYASYVKRINSRYSKVSFSCVITSVVSMIAYIVTMVFGTIAEGVSSDMTGLWAWLSVGTALLTIVSGIAWHILQRIPNR